MSCLDEKIEVRSGNDFGVCTFVRYREVCYPNIKKRNRGYPADFEFIERSLNGCLCICVLYVTDPGSCVYVTEYMKKSDSRIPCK